MEAELIIKDDELQARELDELVRINRSLEDMARASRSVIRTPPQRNPIIYYPIAGAVGGVMAWGLVEIADNLVSVPFFPLWQQALLYMLTGGLVAIWIGLLYGLIHGNPGRALRCAIAGAAVGLIAPVAMGGIAEGVHWLLLDWPMARAAAAGSTGLSPTEGFGFFLSVCSHGFGWALVMLMSALGPGLVMKASKLMLNGTVGGLIGGAIGGAFIPVWRLSLPEAPIVADLLGIAIVGLLVGLCFGIMHFATREAWFVLAKGTLYGKRLVLFKDELQMGSSPKAEILLDGDPQIEPVHVSLKHMGLRWLLIDNGSEAGTFVNGHKVQRCLLNADDVVTMGETVLKFKQRKPMG